MLVTLAVLVKVWKILILATFLPKAGKRKNADVIMTVTTSMSNPKSSQMTIQSDPMRKNRTHLRIYRVYGVQRSQDVILL